MGRASHRKQLPAAEREKAHHPASKPWWSTPQAIGGAVLTLLLVAGLMAMNTIGKPAAAKPADAMHGQPIADSAYFQTTNGELSMEELKGSKLVLYFYEGVG